MLILPLLMSFAIQPIHFYEQSIPATGYVAYEILIETPSNPTKDEIAGAEVVAASILSGGLGQPKSKLQEFSSSRGLPLRANVMPGFIEIQFGCLPADLEVAQARIIYSLSHFHIEDETIKSVLDDLTIRRKSDWQQAPFWFGRSKVLTVSQVNQMAKSWIRPEKLHIGVVGSFLAGRPKGLWEWQTQDWEILDPDFSVAPSRPNWKEPIVRNSRAISEIKTFALMPVKSKQSAAVRLVTVAVLGLGKNSVGYQVLREQQRLSYRVSASLYPGPGGFAPTLLFATSKSYEVGPNYPFELKIGSGNITSSLDTSVNSLSERDLARAKAILRSSLKDKLDFSPFWLRPEGNIDPTGPFGLALLKAYWSIAFGKTYDADEVLSEIDKVSLDEVKRCAEETIHGHVMVSG